MTVFLDLIFTKYKLVAYNCNLRGLIEPLLVTSEGHSLQTAYILLFWENVSKILSFRALLDILSCYIGHTIN